MKFYESREEYEEEVSEEIPDEEEVLDEVDPDVEDSPEEAPVPVADVEDVAAAKVIYTRLPNGALKAHRSS